jgi:hypothetical protein
MTAPDGVGMPALEGGSVSSATVPGGASSRRPLAIVLGVIGVLVVIVGVVLMFATGLPHFLVAGSHVHGPNGHHYYRGAAAVVVGLILVAAAWFVNRSKATATS